jgi:hypothetical protein
MLAYVITVVDGPKGVEVFNRQGYEQSEPASFPNTNLDTCRFKSPLMCGNMYNTSVRRVNFCQAFN